jgi:hypothetical protein
MQNIKKENAQISFSHFYMQIANGSPHKENEDTKGLKLMYWIDQRVANFENMITQMNLDYSS